MKTTALTLGLIGVLALVSACAPPPVAPTGGAPDFTVSTVAQGLHRPWDLAVLPDGRMLVTERVGRISVLDGAQTSTLVEPTDAVAASEGGMLGLAIDPAFSTNGRIYACFVSDASGALDARVVRWSTNSQVTAVSGRSDIVTGIPLSPSNPGRHSGCRLEFDASGYLYITTGDAVRSDTAQNPTSLGGKTLRVDTDGAPAPGNPGGALDPRVLTLGHRNVQGLSFRPSDGRPFSIEHGTNCDDEVNLLTPGANFGWNPGAGGFYNELAPMTDTASVPNAVPARWSSGCPTIAPSGGTFIDGAQWGPWDGTLMMAALAGQQLRVLEFTEGAEPTVVQQWSALTDRGRLRTVVQAPDGDLLVVTDGDPGSVLRLTPVP